jgi:hypothetical protein
MKKLVLFLSCILCSYISFAQITFERDTTKSDGVTSSAHIMELHVYGTNTTGIVKKFVWSVETINTPSAWSNGLCTFPGLCNNIFVGFTDSFEIGVDSQVLFRVEFSTSNTCGDGFVKVNVSPSDDIRNKTPLYFIGKAYCTSIADPIESDRLIQLYPNPTTDIIMFDAAIQNSSLTIFDNSGKKIEELNIENLKGFSYNVSKLSTGNYYAVINDLGNNKTYVKEFSKN